LKERLSEISLKKMTNQKQSSATRFLQNKVSQSNLFYNKQINIAQAA
jgi:hypothetical protein